MIGEKAWEQAVEAFPDVACCYMEPGDLLVMTDPETGTDYRQPYDETDETFLDRIERSKKAGRNLFFEEWPRYEYEKDSLY